MPPLVHRADRISVPPCAPTFWDRWLVVAIGAVIVFGAMLVVARGATDALFDRIIFGTADSPVPEGLAEDYVALVYGVLGAVMIGWMVALLAIVRGPLRRRERWAWTAVAASLGTWFVVDSIFSLITGFGENALLNVGLLVAIAPPLIAMRTELRDASP